MVGGIWDMGDGIEIWDFGLGICLGFGSIWIWDLFWILDAE